MDRKKKARHRQRKSVITHAPPENKKQQKQEPHSSTSSAARQHGDNSLDSQQVTVIHRLPPLFPVSQSRPDKGFLRNVPPYQKSFQHALQTSYEGFVVDMNVLPNEHDIQATLQSAEMEPFFLTDVTQPFGLGTACSPTYVTRCLMGDPGTTYKYLGLRMFAHPWNTPIRDIKDHLSSRVTNHHLPQLYRYRQSTTATTLSDDNNYTSTTATTKSIPYQPSPKGKCFDICLINRMTMNKKLKTEPLDEENKTTVSWHADSSLEHYSAIAVYQTIVRSTAPGKDPLVTSDGSDHEWSIGLRVSPNVEGPKINHRNDDDGGDVDATASVLATPPVAVSLPTNSAYYLLDDFNHHHQHNVLVNKNRSLLSTIRYSLTFRLLRESHNINDMINRCRRCISQFHKKGTKTYRFEQLTLDELESEWIRQFYIQGHRHHSMLWGEWCHSIMSLWDLWSQLETRTFQTIQLLGYAAEGRCLNNHNTDNSACIATDENGESQRNAYSSSNLKLERKLRAKRKKAVSTILDLLNRESASEEMTPNRDNTVSLYESFVTVLEERATMRELWLLREADPAFKKMSEHDRPIAFPARFGSTEYSDGEESAQFSTNRLEQPCINGDSSQQQLGLSPMPGSSAELRNLASTIRAWGSAFVSTDSDDLPAFNPLNKPLLKTETTNETKACTGKLLRVATEDKDTSLAIDNSNLVSLHWEGWKTYDFGLEMQHPWSRALLDGSKTIELRQYELPSPLLGRKIYIIETPVGIDGVSGIAGNCFQANTCIPNDDDFDESTPNQEPRIIGWGIFSTVKQYTSPQDFCRDEHHHLVPSNSSYGWQNSGTNILYGWVVREYGRLSRNEFSSGLRRFRSLFQLTRTKDKLKVEVKNDDKRPSKIPVTRKKIRQKRDSSGNNNDRSSMQGSLTPVIAGTGIKKRRY